MARRNSYLPTRRIPLSNTDYTHNGGHRRRSIDIGEILLVMVTVFVVLRHLPSLANEMRVVTKDVRGRNPHARLLTAVPVMVSVAHLLGTFGAGFGIGFGAFLARNTRWHEASYLGRLLWYGFCLNFVAMSVMYLSYVLVYYSYWFTS